MTKMVRTARGDVVDWDLLRVQMTNAGRVAEPVDVSSKRDDQIARRQRRGRLNAAQTMLKQLEDAAKATNQPQPAVTVSEVPEVDNGWADEPATKSSKRGGQ